MVYRLVTLSKEIGFVGIWAGLGPRMIMTAGLVAGQFLIYGSIKEGPVISFFLKKSYTHHSGSITCSSRNRDS